MRWRGGADAEGGQERGIKKGHSAGWPGWAGVRLRFVHDYFLGLLSARLLTLLIAKTIPSLPPARPAHPAPPARPVVGPANDSW